MTAERPRRGRLTDEDRRLWTHVTAGVRPRRPASRVIEPASPAEPPPPPPPARRVKAALTSKPAGPKPAAAARPGHSGLDGRRDERFRKGELAIESRIDLHGLTLDRAHAALGDFLLGARRNGQRMVLVITGKGGAGGEGALKRFTPRWLAEQPFAAMIAATATARPQHGGAGALYVYLRRKRT